LLGQTVELAPDSIGEEVKAKIAALKVRPANFLPGSSASLMNVHWALQSFLPWCSVPANASLAGSILANVVWGSSGLGVESACLEMGIAGRGRAAAGERAVLQGGGEERRRVLEEAVGEHRHLRAGCFRHGPQGARIDCGNRRLRVVSAGGSAAGEGAGVPGGRGEEANEAVRGDCETSTLICPWMVLMCDRGAGVGLVGGEGVEIVGRGR
jgi:hypothetical protein